MKLKTEFYQISKDNKTGEIVRSESTIFDFYDSEGLEKKRKEELKKILEHEELVNPNEIGDGFAGGQKIYTKNKTFIHFFTPFVDESEF